MWSQSFYETNKADSLQVSLSYTITAGLALCLVLAYYILAYRPDISPFGEAMKGTSTPSFGIIKPNPIDNCLLFWRIGKHNNGPIGNSSVSKNRIRSALIRVVKPPLLLLCPTNL